MHLRVLWVDVVEIVWVAILSTCVESSDHHGESSKDSDELTLQLEHAEGEVIAAPA